ncbi:MAG: zinc-binding dehydrogenase [Alphaproteobacteria bacterium]
MRAIVVEKPGGLEKLQLRKLPAPELGPGEVPIEVAYASCNWSDIQKRQGIYPDTVSYPVILGGEVSGHVAAKGRGVRGFKTGDKVAAIAGPRCVGGFAERVVVPTDYVIGLPDEFPLDLGAAFPMVSLTAYHLTRSAYHVRKGEFVLVHAIGGAVGLMLTQMLKGFGAKVIGTVGGPGKGDRALAFGADRVVDRSREDFVEAARDFSGGKGIDLVIDSLGADILERSFDTLRTYGHIINIGEAAGYPDFPIRPKLYERSTSLAGFEVLHARPGSARWRRGVKFVVDGLASGRLKLPIEAIFPLEQCVDLQRRLEQRGVSGKLLLEIGGVSRTA